MIFFNKKNKTIKNENDTTFDEETSQKNSSDNEYLKTISHIFNEKNEWIGYEYETIVSINHTRTSMYDNSGKIVKIKHTFSDPLNDGTVEDFINYMDRTKYEAVKNNISCVKDMKTKNIDLQTSIEEAKRIREYEKK